MKEQLLFMLLLLWQTQKIKVLNIEHNINLYTLFEVSDFIATLDKN